MDPPLPPLKIFKDFDKKFDGLSETFSFFEKSLDLVEICFCILSNFL